MLTFAVETYGMVALVERYIGSVVDREVEPKKSLKIPSQSRFSPVKRREDVCPVSEIEKTGESLVTLEQLQRTRARSAKKKASDARNQVQAHHHTISIFSLPCVLNLNCWL